jgi:putative PEP-CTERM system histidine kinase
LVRGDPAVKFLEDRNWVIDRTEPAQVPAQYQQAFSSVTFPEDSILVPLRHADQLLGVVRLKRPRTLERLNFEDHDLLKTAGRQVAAFLAQDVAKEQLAATRQFEAFNRLTAFLMHDLKNLVAQQALLVKNAERHKRHPEFVDDVIKTVHNSVDRMRRVLAQLEGHAEASPPVTRVDISRLVHEVANRCADREPKPHFSGAAPAWVTADRERLASVLVNAIRNAQDATPPDGYIGLTLDREGDAVLVRIKDSGIGMDARFVKTRLFKPFDSTKGTQGMGIGAYQAREYIRQAGGDISVASCPGQGTEFCIRLPAETVAIPAAIRERSETMKDMVAK